MKKGYHRGQELTMSELGLSPGGAKQPTLELFAREEARLVLAIAPEEGSVK